MPKIMLKSPEEYKRELELYKQLKNNVYTIFKTPEFQRQEMVQALKLEGEAKDTARELSRIERETKEPEISEIIDTDLLDNLNNELEKGEDIFNTNELNKLSKPDLLVIKEIINVIQRVDKGKGNTPKSRYLQDSLEAVNRRLEGSIRVKKSKDSKPSKSVDDGKSAASAEPMFEEGSKDTQYDFMIDAINSAYSRDDKKENLVKLLMDKYGKEGLENANNLTIADITKYLQTNNYKKTILDAIKEKEKSKPKKEVKPKKKVDKNQKNITDMIEFKPRQQVKGKGLNKNKKSKPKSKPKSNLGKQDQIYYILSKRAGNNNKLMKKRLKK